MVCNESGMYSWLVSLHCIILIIFLSFCCIVDIMYVNFVPVLNYIYKLLFSSKVGGKFDSEAASLLIFYT